MLGRYFFRGLSRFSRDTGGNIAVIFALSSSLSSAQTAAGTIDLMTVNGQNDHNDEDTNFDGILTQMNNALPSPGAVTPSAPMKYLFFVTDGVARAGNERPVSEGGR